MFCEKCGAELLDDALFCSECNTPFAFIEQQEKVKAIKKEYRNTIKNSFKSKGFLLFLIGTICALALSLVSAAVSFLFAMSEEGIYGLVRSGIYLLFCIAPLLGMIYAIKAFTQDCQADTIAKLKAFSVFQKILFGVIKILFTVATVVLLALIAIIAFELEDVETVIIEFLEGVEDFEINGFTFLAETLLEILESSPITLAIIFGASGIVLFLLFHFTEKLHKKICTFFEKLSLSYKEKQVYLKYDMPCVWAYILSALLLALGASIAVFAIDFVGVAILFATNAVFFVFSTLFFTFAKKEQKDTILEYYKHKKLLVEIANATKASLKGESPNMPIFKENQETAQSKYTHLSFSFRQPQPRAEEKQEEVEQLTLEDALEEPSPTTQAGFDEPEKIEVPVQEEQIETIAIQSTHTDGDLEVIEIKDVE